uniref:Coatomer subunit gamma n=1 Tax=Angiostrongylus cantonensis TaxID=6313 RepID=A0A158P6B0_ANGCA
MKREKKDEESSGNPFAHLDKTSVLQEARAFNETPINARKCSVILTKLLYLIQQGETIGRTEATEAFFAVTKLWQSKDANLRRLVYLAVKDLSGIADDVIIVTSSLTKDMTGREDVYRAAAIRALCRITDTGMLQTIERYMKQYYFFYRRNYILMLSLTKMALCLQLHLFLSSLKVVRRWANEVQEAVSSDNLMVQYHALGLLYHIRCNDKLAVNKLVQKFSKTGLRSPHAVCYLIRIATRLIEEDDQVESSVFSFIEACLRHKSEMVVYEAANAIVALPNTTPAELTPAISVLQLFCSSPKAALRFAAVRTLNQVSMKHPNAVMSCNVDLEKLITDSNRSIATLAITTLLKTGAESSVERLMKQISSFVSEISDEFKIVVVDAIRSLCGRYPRKHAVMMPFLANMLRNDGGFEYKKAIVETIIAIVEDNPDAKTAGLAHLCEFIEDCEHDSLATRVLHLLGREAPKTPNPSSYIRFIYNRVILESTKVRAAAVTALAKFGAQCAELSPSIQVLLKRCLLDSDDEVRDRATFYLTLLTEATASVINSFVLDGLQVMPSSLERCLSEYVRGDSFSAPFNLQVVPVTSQPLSTSEKRAPVLPDVMTIEKPTQIKKEPYAEQLSQIPKFADLGPLFHSSARIALTDDVTEYTVHAIKHVFMSHVVVQFDCKNTLNDQLLENVVVQLDDVDCDWAIVDVVPIDSLPYNETKSTYVLLEFPESGSVTGTFAATLKFNVKDVDPVTGEAESDDTYEDSYVLEEFELSVSDLVAPISKQNFMSSWEALSNAATVDETFHLTTVGTLAEAVKKVSELLGMAPCERSDRIPEGKTQHSTMLAGVFRAGLIWGAQIAENVVIITILTYYLLPTLFNDRVYIAKYNLSQF